MVSQVSYVKVILTLVTLACGVVAAKHHELFGIVSERLTEENSRQFSAGICNASLPLNDHLYQLIGWCVRLGRGRKCLSRGVIACLFKKYIDSGMTFTAADGMASGDLDKRQQIFWDNLQTVAGLIEARLAGKEPASEIKGAARYGITKFMHLSPIEFRERYLSSLIGGANPRANTTGKISASRLAGLRRRRSVQQQPPGVVSFQARPDRVDWRDHGAVTDVKDQKSCGACWAFAVTEVAETEFAGTGQGPLTELSVQQVTDCTLGSQGCSGGNICTAANFYSSGNQRIVQENLYPYVAKNEVCRQVTGGYQVGTANVMCQNLVSHEDVLLEYLWQSGTAAVAVDAHMWQYYIDGVIMHNCDTTINHAVQIVGYDLTSGPVPFYLVRNSWGKNWGMEGYLNIAQGQNLCGVAEQVVTFGVVGN